MMKVFLSHPMRGKNLNEIAEIRSAMVLKMEDFIYDDEGIEIIDNVGHDGVEPKFNKETTGYLGLSIEMMGDADLVVFSKDYKAANGCLIEEKVCQLYGIQRLYL